MILFIKLYSNALGILYELERIHRAPYCCVADCIRHDTQHRSEASKSNELYMKMAFVVLYAVEFLWRHNERLIRKWSTYNGMNANHLMSFPCTHFAHFQLFFIFFSTSSFKLEIQHHWWRCRLHISFLPPIRVKRTCYLLHCEYLLLSTLKWNWNLIFFSLSLSLAFFSICKWIEFH